MRVVIVEGEGAVSGVNLGRPIVTNGAFATRLFSNYFEDLFVMCMILSSDRDVDFHIDSTDGCVFCHLHGSGN